MLNLVDKPKGASVILDQNVFADKNTKEFFKNLKATDSFIRLRSKIDQITYPPSLFIELSRFNWKKYKRKIKKPTLNKDSEFIFSQIFNHYMSHIDNEVKKEIINSAQKRIQHLQEKDIGHRKFSWFEGDKEEDIEIKFLKHLKEKLEDEEASEQFKIIKIIFSLNEACSFDYASLNLESIRQENNMFVLKNCLSIFKNEGGKQGSKFTPLLKACKPVFSLMDYLLSKDSEKQREFLEKQNEKLKDYDVFDSSNIEKILSFLKIHKRCLKDLNFKNLYNKCKLKVSKDLADVELIHDFLFGVYQETTESGVLKQVPVSICTVDGGGKNDYKQIIIDRIRLYKIFFNLLDLFSNEENAPNTPNEFKELSLFKNIEIPESSEINILNRNGEVKRKITISDTDSCWLLSLKCSILRFLKKN